MFANLPIYPTSPMSSYLPIPGGLQSRFPVPNVPFAGTPQLIPTHNPYIPFTNPYGTPPFATPPFATPPFATPPFANPNPYAVGFNPYFPSMAVPPMPTFPQFVPQQFVPNQGWTTPNTPMCPV